MHVAYIQRNQLMSGPVKYVAMTVRGKRCREILLQKASDNEWRSGAGHNALTRSHSVEDGRRCQVLSLFKVELALKAHVSGSNQTSSCSYDTSMK